MKWLLRNLVTVVVLLAACAGFVLLTGAMRHEESATVGAPPQSAQPRAVAVTVEPVQFRPVERAVEAVGTLHGYEVVTIAAEIDGQVQRVHHDMADRVRPGEPLLTIDPTDYELALRRAQKALETELSKLGLTAPDPNYDVEKVPAVQQARARMENATLQLRRIETLAERQVVTQEQLDTAKAEYAVTTAAYHQQVLLARGSLVTIQDLQLAVSMAQQKLDDTVVRAPVPSQAVPGVGGELTYAIMSRRVAEGSFVRSGTEVFQLVIDRPLKLVTAVPERHAEEIQPGQQVSITTSVSSRSIRGTVTRINPVIDSATRTFDVEIIVPNAQGELKAGAFAKAAILTQEKPHVATVPLESLVSFAGTTKVFVVENGRAKAVPITPGQQSTDWVEVASPQLPEKALVVTSGQSAIVDGEPVTVRTAEALAADHMETRR